MKSARTRLVIAIDGPAASGKSSTAQWVAERLGLQHVDSGALYRAVTAARLNESRDATGWAGRDLLHAASRVTLRPSGRSFAAHIDGVDATTEIRTPEVTQHVSRVASIREVREWVNDQVRAVARTHNLVVDGRDMGTAVFPEAALKVFLVADPWERARRRLAQRLQRAASDDEIAAETERLVQRDAQDATQSVQARDAILVDTTFLTQEEQVDRIVALARAVTSRGDATSSA